MKNQKILPPTCLNAAIVFMIVIYFLLPGLRLIYYPWNFLGAIPFIAGVFLNLHADRAFKKFETTVKPFETSSALITEGTFRFTRNPMYLGFELMLLGVAVFMGTVAPFIIVILFPFIIHHQFIKHEEKMLDEKFGQTWQDYKNRVRRWI